MASTPLIVTAAPRADTGGPMVFVALFGIVGLVFMPTIYIVEAIVLLVLRWGSIWHCLLDSAIANIASSLVGFAGACALFAGMEPESNVGWVITLVVAAGLSIAIEGAVLSLLKRHPARLTWRAAVVTNAVSYVLLIGFFVLALTGVIHV